MKLKNNLKYQNVMENHNILEQLLLKTIRALLYVILAIPVIVVPFTLYPFVIVKTVILRTIIEAVFLCYIVLLSIDRKYRPPISGLFWSVTIFFAIMVITTLTSMSPYKSWWGTWERMFGTFNYLHYYLLFVVLISIRMNLEKWKLLFRVSCFTSLIVCMAALLMRFDVFVMVKTSGDRLIGTIGNANHLAAYLLFHIFIAIYLYYKDSNKFLKNSYLFILILNVICLIMTGSRGAIAGLGGSLVLFSIVSIFYKSKIGPSAKASLILIFTFLVLFTGFFLSRDTKFIKDSLVFDRLARIHELKMTETRIMLWEWGLKGIAEKPILGIGPENYNIVFNKYFNPEYYQISPIKFWNDRSHNVLIDIAVMTGIGGLAAYLTIYILVFVKVFTRFKRDEVSNHAFSFAFLVLSSYFIQNLFSFDTLNSMIMFFFILGFIQCRFFEEAGDSVELKQRTKNFTKPVLIVILTVFVLFCCSILFLQITAISASSNAYKAISLLNSGRISEANRYFSEAYEDAVNKIEPAILQTTSIHDFIERNNISAATGIIEDLISMTSRMDAAIKLDTENMFLHFYQAKNYSLLANQTGKTDYLYSAMRHCRETIRLSPGRVRPYWLEAQIFLQLGDPNSALDAMNKSIALYSGYAESYYNRALIFQNLKEYKKALDDLNIAVSRSPGYVSALLNRGSLLLYFGEYNKAVKNYNSVIDKYPASYFAYNGRGKAYFYLEDYKKALNNFQKATAINPNYSEAYFNSGLVYLKMQKNDEAILNLEKAVKLGSREAEALLDSLTGK